MVTTQPNYLLYLDPEVKIFSGEIVLREGNKVTGLLAIGKSWGEVYAGIYVTEIFLIIQLFLLPVLLT